MPQLSFLQMYELIWNNPIDGARIAKTQHQSHRRRKYEMAAVGYALAFRLRTVPGWIDKFYAMPFFGGGYERNSDRLLLHCLQYVYDDRTRSDSDRAGEHARAMQLHFDQELCPTSLLDVLTAQGFRGLCANGQTSQPTTTQPKLVHEDGSQITPSSPAAVSGGLVNTGKVISPDLDNKEGRDRPPPSKRQRPKLRTEKETLDRYLLVTMEPLEDLHKVLALELGESRHIKITRVLDEDSGLFLYQGKLTILSGIRPSGSSAHETVQYPRAST